MKRRKLKREVFANKGTLLDARASGMYPQSPEEQKTQITEAKSEDDGLRITRPNLHEDRTVVQSIPDRSRYVPDRSLR